MNRNDVLETLANMLSEHIDDVLYRVEVNRTPYGDVSHLTLVFASESGEISFDIDTK